jgi:hypothetical protein
LLRVTIASPGMRTFTAGPYIVGLGRPLTARIASRGRPRVRGARFDVERTEEDQPLQGLLLPAAVDQRLREAVEESAFVGRSPWVPKVVGRRG